MNASNTKRLRLQLEHDGEQKTKDRLAALRREIYLRAPREMARAINYLGRLPYRDLAEIGDDEGISGFSEVAAQISVLSDLPTVAAVNSLNITLAHHLIDAIRSLDKLQSLRVDIALRQDRFNFVTNELQRMQADQQRMQEMGSRDPDRVAGLTTWIQIRLEEQGELSSELSNLRAEFQQLVYEHHVLEAERSPRIAKEAIGVMREVRKELGLAHDLDGFEREMTAKSDELRIRVLETFKDWAEAMKPDPTQGH
ncbi:hypothetical protein [Arenimonas sp. SCN 70-307]|uniref:hypothetical protein n=1 Tax=Arenimonas sp. SCN 70-307 TaxID=1660089 RepID=UPI0025C2950A|nr:hypothetical protein [Arenimonas sp. SCN 70-307]